MLSLVSSIKRIVSPVGVETKTFTQVCTGIGIDVCGPMLDDKGRSRMTLLFGAMPFK
jgi:hypothetical protein